MSSSVAKSIQDRKTPKDVFFTPKSLALEMIEMCNITPDMSVLDPCRGGGIFYDNLPDCNKDWCEITDGKDFFDYKDRVDLVISNPPFSMWNKWLEHTCEITDKFCYVMGVINLTDHRIRELHKKGFGITAIRYSAVEWWFCHSVIIIVERNKPSIISVSEKRHYCDDCCKPSCGRGLAGNSPNVCCPKRTKKVKD
jgi:hypothetical protein